MTTDVGTTPSALYCTIVLSTRSSDAREWTRPASPHLPGVDLLTARFSRHAYARHTHDAYVLAVVERGAQAFAYRRSTCVATAGDLVILEPGEVHDGRPYGERGYLYRTLHISPSLFADERERLPAFASAVIRDPSLRRTLMTACRLLDDKDAPVESCREALEAAIATLCERHACDARTRRATDAPGERSLATFVHRTMSALAGDERVTVDELAARCGVTRSHLSRAFARTYGLPPYAWLLQKRLSEACKRLHAGEPAASVAAATGFVDQSHLIRRFKAVYGFTPGQWAACVDA